MGEKKSNNYWRDLFLPASGGLVTKEAVLGYFHAKGRLPTQQQTQKTLEESLKGLGDTLPRYTLGRPGIISSAAGIAAASGLYFLFRQPTTVQVSEPQHQGTIEGRQLER